MFPFLQVLCPPYDLTCSVQSQAVKVNGQIYVSGQIPADKDGNLVEGSISDKTKASCEGMKAILEEAGSSLSKVIKVRRIAGIVIVFRGFPTDCDHTRLLSSLLTWPISPR